MIVRCEYKHTTSVNWTYLLVSNSESNHYLRGNQNIERCFSRAIYQTATAMTNKLRAAANINRSQCYYDYYRASIDKSIQRMSRRLSPPPRLPFLVRWFVLWSGFLESFEHERNVKAMDDRCPVRGWKMAVGRRSRWMREIWREPSNDSGDASVTTLVSFANSNEQVLIPMQQLWCQILSNSCQRSRHIFFVLIPTAHVRRWITGNTLYQLPSLPLTYPTYEVLC